ncbi:hypothetical protein D1007_39317 [Hordeum vulgare]|nr:hypothetical protein D1007_39317 [Hordeum vulgare]
MKLYSSDVTYLNIVALMETQGFVVYDLLCHIENPCLGEQGLLLVESNAQLQKIKRHYEEVEVLNLLARACPSPVSQFQSQELCPIVYKEVVVYDMSEPPIYDVDQEGVVFESQSCSFSVSYATGVFTQESVNVKGNLEEDDTFVLEEEGIVHVHAEKKKKKQKLPVRRGSTTRSDPTTGIHTLIDAYMEKYGVDVLKSMAYREKNIAIESMLGECVDGCFINLSTGAQQLDYTSRDGNNNIYPLAFGIVGQEDTPSWCWFLHQLKIYLGGEVRQFGPYTIMSDKQKATARNSNAGVAAPTTASTDASTSVAGSGAWSAA